MDIAPKEIQYSDIENMKRRFEKLYQGDVKKMKRHLKVLKHENNNKAVISPLSISTYLSLGAMLIAVLSILLSFSSSDDKLTTIFLIFIIIVILFFTLVKEKNVTDQLSLIDLPSVIALEELIEEYKDSDKTVTDTSEPYIRLLEHSALLYRQKIHEEILKGNKLNEIIILEKYQEIFRNLEYQNQLIDYMKQCNFYNDNKNIKYIIKTLEKYNPRI